MQNPRLRTVYRQRKWPLPAPVRKIMALACRVFFYTARTWKRGWGYEKGNSRGGGTKNYTRKNKEKDGKNI